MIFMEFIRTRVMGSSYVGLFAIANDKLCFVPKGIEERAYNEIKETLDVKIVKTSIYGSSLLSVFGKMNNKHIFLPAQTTPEEIEEIEKEIEVKLIDTEMALGNLIAVNDNGAIVSKTLGDNVVKELQDTGLEVAHTNIAKADVVGSSIVATSKGFVMNPNASEEEVKKVQETLNVKGGFSTANTGDVFIRNSVIANSKGAITGDLTTGHELNHIDEALEG
jgi:translation initiation factor 6